MQPDAYRQPRAACLQLLHPRHATHPRRYPMALVPCATHARGYAPACRVEALANERPCASDFHRSRERAAADEQSNRRRIGRGREGIDVEALPSATAMRARHFANDTPRAAAQGPHTGPRRHSHRRSCRWATLNRRRRTHGSDPSKHPRATACRSFTGVVRRQPVLGQARWTDRSRDGPDASSGALHPSTVQLSELRIIGDKAGDAREISSSRCGRGPLARWWSACRRRSAVRELAPRRAQGGA